MARVDRSNTIVKKKRINHDDTIENAVCPGHPAKIVVRSVARSLLVV